VLLVFIDDLHDPDLLDALEAMEPRSFVGVAWRVTWATRDPLVGGTGGGRWHPPNDFEALYTSLEEDGAVAEIYHHLSQAPVFSSSHVKINELQVRSARALAFDDIPALAAVGVDEQAFRSGDTTRTREIGAAARFLDLEGLIVPSARWPCANLVLFPDRLPDLGMLKVLASRDINWPAWRERLSPSNPAKGSARH
jgi:hypothetical protein